MMKQGGKSEKISRISIIGAAVVDVLARPVSERLFETGSIPMEETGISFGGDALNEAAVLARLGKQAELVSKLGQDTAGEMVLDYCRKNGVDVSRVRVEAGISTGVNVVLIREDGERFFLTNPKSSLRRLTEEDLTPYLDGLSDLVSFASIFVSPCLGIGEMERIFRRLKEKRGRILCADMTKAKNGERLSELEPFLPYIDYLFPNEEEIALLTGDRDLRKNAARILEAGAGCAVIKCGARGCYIRSRREEYEIPACHAVQCVDTTGAGDTFAAGFLWGLSEGLPLEACGRFANAAASCAVECLGAVNGVRSLEQVMERMK